MVEKIEPVVSGGRLPPVFVMNLYYSGLGIARSLRGRGMKVYGLSSDKTAPGLNSRFFDEVYFVPDGRDEPEALYQRLLEIRAMSSQAPVLFPTRDFDILFLTQYGERLTPFYRLPYSDNACAAISRILDKLQLAEIAQQHHISTPVTIVCRSFPEIDVQNLSLRFPIVLKPRFAYQWRREGAWVRVGARKAILVETHEKLRKEYALLAGVSEEVLLQEFVPGADHDIVVCCCYVNPDGKLLAYFTARKLRQDPPLFGTGCVVEAVIIPEIVDLSVRLLQACGYTGLAEVEFKYDKATNSFVLIEINPRHWDQHELGRLVGVNLTWVAYQDIISRAEVLQSPMHAGAGNYRWVAEREFLFLLLRNAYRGFTELYQQTGHPKGTLLREGWRILKNSAVELTSLLRGRKIFGVLDVHDPIPGGLLLLRICSEGIHLAITYARRLIGRRPVVSTD